MGSVNLTNLKSAYEIQIEAGKQRAQAIIANQDFHGLLNTTLLELCVIGGELQLHSTAESTAVENDAGFKSNYTRAAIVEKIINKEVYVVYSKATDLPWINSDGACLMYTDLTLADKAMAEFENSTDKCYMNAIPSGNLFGWINFHYHNHGMYKYALNYPVSNFILNTYTIVGAYDKHSLPGFVYEACRMWQEVRKDAASRNQGILDRSRDNVDRAYRQSVFIMPVSVKDEYGNIIKDATREQLNQYGWTPFTIEMEGKKYVRLFTNEDAIPEKIKNQVSGSMWLNVSDLAGYDGASDYQIDYATISHYVSRQHLRDLVGGR